MTDSPASPPARCPHCGAVPRTLKVLNAWNALLIQCPNDRCQIYSRPFSPDRWAAYAQHQTDGASK